MHDRSDRSLRMIRSLILLLFAVGVSAWAAIDAQEPPPAGRATAPPAAPAPAAVPAKEKAPANDPAASSADAKPDAPPPRVFVPSKAIQADQEIAYPADF